jgi:hypothetical protein
MCVKSRDAPNQILIGANDRPLYCVLLLACAGWLCFLRYSSESERGQLTPYIFGLNDDDFRIPEGGQKAKDWVQQHMLAEEVFHLPEFHIGGPVGTHSIRKYASTNMQGRTDARKTRRIFVAAGRKESVIRMSIMTLSSRSLMQKLLESSALVDHVSMFSKSLAV